MGYVAPSTTRFGQGLDAYSRPALNAVDFALVPYPPAYFIFPAIADVKSGVSYGITGTEYTGTYSPSGGGLSAGTLLIDPITGQKWVYVQGRVIVGVE
jgi:hypothetical protein